mmetsp:Transcript_66479/g.138834  ORF Transcript_66479/g.138834 Transcript_66479/m.138834 type:complete len:210 (+) Transcript_66479:419-1048(+)
MSTSLQTSAQCSCTTRRSCWPTFRKASQSSGLLPTEPPQRRSRPLESFAVEAPPLHENPPPPPTPTPTPTTAAATAKPPLSLLWASTSTRSARAAGLLPRLWFLFLLMKHRWRKSMIKIHLQEMIWQELTSEKDLNWRLQKRPPRFWLDLPSATSFRPLQDRQLPSTLWASVLSILRSARSKVIQLCRVQPRKLVPSLAPLSTPATCPI